MISSQLNRIANKGTILSFQTADLTGLANTTSFWVDNSGNPKFRIGTGTVQTIATVANLGSYIPLSGTTALAGDIIPTTTNTNDLGSNTNRLRGGYYQTVYATNKMFVGNITSSAYDFTVNIGLTTLLGGTTTVNGAILPNVGGLNIGGTSSGQHWGNVYATNINNQVGTLNLQQGGTNRLRLLSSHVEVLSSDFYVFSTGTSAGKITAGLGGGGALHGNTTLAFLAGGGGGTEAARFHSSGNFSIGSTTDAGFRLDVNGTARVQGDATFSGIVYMPTNGTVSMRTTVNTNGFGFDGINQPFISSNNNIVLNGNINSQYVDQYNIGGTNRYRSIALTRQVAVGNYTFTSSSGVDNIVNLTPNFNTTGTASSNLIYGGAYYQANGSGAQNLINLGEFSAANGGGTFTSRFVVDRLGKTTIADDFVNETVGKGWVTRSPDGTYYRITVNNGGTTLNITAI